MANEDRASRPEGPISRRSEIRRKLSVDRHWLRSPVVVQTTAIGAIFAILAWVICDWSRQQGRWVEGQVLTSPHLNRVDYQLENEALTRQQRELARRNAPRIYEVNRSYLESIRASIEGLPQAVAGKASIDEVGEALVKDFRLDEASLVLLQGHQDLHGPTEAWKRATERLVTSLWERSPIITREEFQKFATAASREVAVPAAVEVSTPVGPLPPGPATAPGAPSVSTAPSAPGVTGTPTGPVVTTDDRVARTPRDATSPPPSAPLTSSAPQSPVASSAPSASAATSPPSAPAPIGPIASTPPGTASGAPPITPPVVVPTAVPIGRAAIELPDGEGTSFRTRLFTEAVEAGFPSEVARIVINVILTDPQPTLRCDEVATLARADAAAAAVRPVLEAHPRGEVIGMPGDPVTRERFLRLSEEQSQTFARTPAVDRWSASIGLLGLCILLAGSICVALGIFKPGLLENAWKLAVLLGGLLILTLVTAVVAVNFPRFSGLMSMGVSLFAASSIALLHDRRTALVAAGALAALLALSLTEPFGFVLATLLTAATYVALLRDVRHRSALVRATSITALVAACAIASVDLLDTPLRGGFVQIIVGAVMAGVGTLATGFILIGVLPTMERVFGVVTGLTLAELRDPRQPLLRQLQEKAPCTWTHSLQVANIAEAAAESIGADGLLTYVGALYHDIGKMNKPEYFAENQVDGENRHDRISPAMSFLVIIGHVKDGVELAAEYRLPRALRQMIESHHGTTLVEYFFREAQRRAEMSGADPDDLDESAWRYPGPKPQTREAAILLICDAVESTTRTLAEPTPARIEQIVRMITRRRLEDGQFDECPLTFRELHTLEESISKSLGSIYHGRVVYPSTALAATAERYSEVKDFDDERSRSGEKDQSDDEVRDADQDGPTPPRPRPTSTTRRAAA